MSATVALPSVRPSTRDRRHQRFLQETELAVPDDFDPAEYRGEENAHRNDAGRQELQVVSGAGPRKRRTETISQRQQKQYRLAQRAHDAGTRAGIPFELA